MAQISYSAIVTDDEAIVETIYTGLHAFDCKCAWCLAEAEIEPEEGDSHGICTFHRDEIYAEYKSRRGR